MLGLFGTLNLATRSLSVQRRATEVAGHNLANVNNPAYARQRLDISTAYPLRTPLGAQGTGAEAIAITQLRNVLLDSQIQSESSVRGSLEAQQRALQYTQANLGQEFDSLAMGPEGAAAAAGIGGQHGLAEGLSDLFNAFQSLSSNPTSSSERQVVLAKAHNLTSQFNQIAARLQATSDHLDQSLQSDAADANAIISDVATLNSQIAAAEVGGRPANDLRDLRQQKFETLAKLTQFTAVPQPNGIVDVVINGTAMTDGPQVIETIETFADAAGRLQLRFQSSGAPLAPGGGSLHGTLDARDGALASLRTRLDTLASELAGQVNAIHSSGYSLGGASGEPFFSGTTAADLGVNATLANDPSRIQASGVNGATGDNQTILSLARLGSQKIPALNDQTFSQHYNQTVAALGQSLSTLNSQISSQDIVNRMLLQQRTSTSGVSLDEEMTDLIRFQRAFDASAKLIVTIDEMLETVVGMKR